MRFNPLVGTVLAAFTLLVVVKVCIDAYQDDPGSINNIIVVLMYSSIMEAYLLFAY